MALHVPTPMTAIQERALSEWNEFKQHTHSLSLPLIYNQTKGPSFEWLDMPTTQKLMDSLQRNLDSDVNDRSQQKKHLDLLRYLSKLFRTLPLSQVIKKITVVDPFPVAGGGFADIWRGTLDDKSETVCVKVLRLVMEQDVEKRDKIRKQFLNEALLWRQLKHPNILPLLGVNMELFSPSFCLISPWMGHRDIISYLKKHPEHDLSLVLYEVAAGMHYLHSRYPPLVHGDIRGGNILVTDDLHCCLADFGLTLVASSSHLTASISSSGSVNGATRWLAPEYIAVGAGSAPRNHTSRDVYAFGCTILEILTLELPFKDHPNDASVIFTLMNCGRPARPSNIWYPDEIWDLTTLCWAQKPGDRPSAADIHQILKRRINPSPDLTPSRTLQYLSGSDLNAPSYPLAVDNVTQAMILDSLYGGRRLNEVKLNLFEMAGPPDSESEYLPRLTPLNVRKVSGRNATRNTGGSLNAWKSRPSVPKSLHSRNMASLPDDFEGERFVAPWKRRVTT